MHNTIDFNAIKSIRELNALHKAKKIDGNQYLEALHLFEYTSYKYDDNGNQIDIVHHAGKSPIGK